MDLTVIVLDTNFVLEQLKIVQQLVQAGPQHSHVVMVPKMVLQELDRLKTRDGGPAAKARAANDRLFEILAARHPGMAGQKDDQCLRANLSGDDAILDCARFFDQLGYLVILLSNDRNICSRALVNGLRSVTWRPGVTAEDILTKIGEEAAYLRNGQAQASNLMPHVKIPEPEQMRVLKPCSALANDATVPATATDVDMQDEIEVPGLIPFPQREFTDVGSLERAIKSTLLANAKNLVLLCHRAELNAAQVEAIESPELTMKLFSEICAVSLTHSLHESITDALINHKASLNPSSKEDYRLFILFWGSFCINILDVNPIRDLCVELALAYEAFYARPGDHLRVPQWIEGHGPVDLAKLPSQHAH